MKNANNYFNRPLRLLPNYFKKIGLGVIILTILGGIFYKGSHIVISTEKKDILKHCVKDLFLIGLVFIVFAKDKIEDELTQLIRMKALIAAFIYGITFMICGDIIYMIFQEPMQVYDSFGLYLQTFLMYLIYYNFAKLSR